MSIYSLSTAQLLKQLVCSGTALNLPAPRPQHLAVIKPLRRCRVDALWHLLLLLLSCFHLSFHFPPHFFSLSLSFSCLPLQILLKMSCFCPMQRTKSLNLDEDYEAVETQCPLSNAIMLSVLWHCSDRPDTPLCRNSQNSLSITWFHRKSGTGHLSQI